MPNINLQQGHGTSTSGNGSQKVCRPKASSTCPPASHPLDAFGSLGTPAWANPPGRLHGHTFFGWSRGCLTEARELWRGEAGGPDFDIWRYEAWEGDLPRPDVQGKIEGGQALTFDPLFSNLLKRHRNGYRGPDPDKNAGEPLYPTGASSQSL